MLRPPKNTVIKSRMASKTYPAVPAPPPGATTAPSNQRADGLRVLEPRAHDANQNFTREFKRAMKIACDDLYDNPLDPAARAAMIDLLRAGPAATTERRR